MTPLPPRIDLARIREHEGSQHRAWEELSYLLAWDLDGLDAATSIERRGTPDGGIEFSCVPTGLGRGGRWAWQAKYLFRFDRSTFQQMDRSVRSALKSTPDLERYTFVLPKDRSTVGLRQWREWVPRWNRAAKRLGRDVDFEFHGHSDVVRALTQDRHAGAIRYFFDATFLTDSFFTNQVTREALNLGQRYDPRVNVETEARRIVDAACRAPRFVAELRRLIGAVGQQRPYLHQSTYSEQVVIEGVKALEALFDAWKPTALSAVGHLADPGPDVFRSIQAAASDLQSGVKAQVRLTDERIDELTEQSRRAEARRKSSKPKSESKRRTKGEEAEVERASRRETLWSFRSALSRVDGAVDELLWYLNGNEVNAAIGGSVLLVGEAGCGKSHLVADLATERVEHGLPSMLVLGQALSAGPLDPQLVSSVGLDSLPLADVLQALDVAARLRRQGRALLVIDAINEGPGADLWEHALRGFVAEVARYDWVALVITVRDVYEAAVAPAGVDGVVRAVHPGLAGHEEEALARYADLYELRLPDVPALLPELSNPLFLRSLCQSVRGRGLTAIPREAASLVWVFDGLVEAVDVALRQPSRLDYPDWENKASAAVDAIAAAMVAANSESLPLTDANAVCLEIHPDPRHSHSLLNGLIVEGLLLRERVDRDGTPTETVRFTYQRLSDHLRAEVLLTKHPTDRDLAAVVRAFSQSPDRWTMRGIIEALVLLVPERRGKELTTVLRLGEPVRPQRARRPGDHRAWLREEVQEAFIDTLIWRSPAAFTERTRALLRRYQDAGVVDNGKWLRTITGLACVPGHPLNVQWLDSVLFDFSLPQRDDAWSCELVWLYYDEVNSITRTIDWAWSSSDAPEDVARLAALFLAWLFTSPNRRLRDTATKALVSVTESHPRVLAGLVEHFSPVNDAYVLDRVVAAAYGHVLRCRHRDVSDLDLDELNGLGQAVYDAVFGDPVRTHLMMRHHARSCVHVLDGLLRASGRSLDRDLRRTDPPYESSWPLRAPSARALATGFGRDYSSYLGAVTELDWEFEEKLERRVLSDFSLPNQEHIRSARRNKLKRDRQRALEALVDAAPPSRKTRVRRRAEWLLANPVERGITQIEALRRVDAWKTFEESLSKSARERAGALQRIAGSLRMVERETFHPDPDLCVRWVAGRVLELGWTKERFGNWDRRGGRGEGDHVSERIAKKYERIAFQELCGHLADHCLIDESWGGEPEPYAGPWQISGTLDLDPSVLLRGDIPDPDTPASRMRDLRVSRERAPAWWRTLADHQLSEAGSNDDWLSNRSDIPHPDTLLSATDPLGDDWVAIERHQRWALEDPNDLDPTYRRDKRALWIRCQANITRAHDTEHRAWAANRNWMGLSGISTPMDTWVAHFGEYPDVEPWPSLLDESDRERLRHGLAPDPGLDALPLGWEAVRVDDQTTVPTALSSVSCHQDSGKDLAAEDNPGAMIPSRILLDLLGAAWTGGRPDDGGLDLGPVEREFSWAAAGKVVAFCAAGREYGTAQVLWVRAEALTSALAAADLSMWAWVLGEKIYWTGSEPSSDRTDVFAGVQLIPPPMTVWGCTIERDRGRDHGSGGRRERVWAERASDIPDTLPAQTSRPR